MGLSLDDGGGKGGIPTGMPGVYINDAVVISVEDISNTTPKGFKQAIDVGVELTLEVGRSFQPKLRLFGNFKNVGGKITWGGAFKLRDLFKKIGCAGGLPANADGSLVMPVKIPIEWLGKLKGQNIWRLSYVNRIRPDGKLGYSDWNEVWLKSEDPLKMAESFRKSYSEDGYPKNYNPDLLEQVGGASFDPSSFDSTAPPVTGL